jgi:hypothetical protein
MPSKKSRNLSHAWNGFHFALGPSKYPPAKPGALGIGPLEAAGGVADAAPQLLAHLKVVDQRHRFI